MCEAFWCFCCNISCIFVEDRPSILGFFALCLHKIYISSVLWTFIKVRFDLPLLLSYFSSLLLLFKYLNIYYRAMLIYMLFIIIINYFIIMIQNIISCYVLQLSDFKTSETAFALLAELPVISLLTSLTPMIYIFF